jgi:hypothetical protein
VWGTPPARANSVFSAGGLGEPSLEENARLRALGGAGAAEHGPSGFSMVNPASIAEARYLSIEATMLSTRRSISTNDFGSESAYESSFPSIRLVVRLPGGTVLGGSYLAGTDGQFQVDRAETTGAASFLRIEGTGGISFARLTLARRVTGAIRAGVDFDVVSGSYREEWRRDFSDPSLAQARDTLEADWDRLGRWRLGLQYARERFALGAAYETARRLPLTYRQRTTGSEVKTTGRTLEIPDGYVAGFSVGLGDRGRVVGQYRRQNWNDESLKSDLVDFRALERYSIGFERTAASLGGRFDKLPLRLGATFLKWPDLLPRTGAADVSGGVAPVDEWAVSIGSGLLTPDGGGSFDFSLEGGRRGNQDELGARETFFRLALSLRVSDETWK